MATRGLAFKRPAQDSVEQLVIRKRARPDEDQDSGSNYSASPSEHDEAEGIDPAPSTPASTPPLTDSQRRLKCYHCPFEGCGKAFNRPCRLEEHIRSHTNERPFACENEGCTKAFLRQTHLNRHIKDEHNNERNHECDWPGCGKKFGTATRLRRHREVHENKFYCTDYPPCNETFRKHSTLQRHVLNAHLGEKAFRCSHVDEETGEKCTQAYDTAASLRAHQGRVHGGSRYFCTECMPDANGQPSLGQGVESPAPPAAFATYALLQAHIKAVHPPTCAHCGLTCSTHRQLQAHIDLAHSGVPLSARRKYTCPYPHCGQGFTKQGNLNVHIQSSHKGVRNFICGTTSLSNSRTPELRAWTAHNACARAFGSKGNLEEHVRTQHLGLEGSRKARARAKAEASGQSFDDRPQGRPRKQQRRGDAAVDAATLLTGAGYAEQTGRTIACVRPDCPHRFHRDYDLDLHCRSAHGMAEVEIAEAVAERDALAGGKFWIGGAEEVEEWDDDGGGAGGAVDVRGMGMLQAPVVDPLLEGDGNGGEAEGQMVQALWSYVHEEA